PLSQPPIHEGNALTLSGSFASPAVLATNGVVIHWGDGSADAMLSLAAGVVSFKDARHTYLDNPAGQPTGTFAITVSVSDKDAGSFSGGTSVQVSNVAPADLVRSEERRVGNENSTRRLGGSFTDTGILATHTIAINW